MPQTIQQENFLNSFFALLDETFENHRGIYLDENTSIFPTLETVTAEEASIPVGGKCASLAAQVAHVTFYLEVLERYIFLSSADNVDWGEIWQTVEKVTPKEWQDLKSSLKQTYLRINRELHKLESWDEEEKIGGAMAIVVHTAYHLGEIRQALCTLK
jgi:hypothetical protein